MSVVIQARYEEGLRCEMVHQPSGTALRTDAPKDNAGRGESFSPTDLVATGLLSCALTTMAIKAPKEGLPWSVARGTVTKHMTREAPRRIAALDVEIELPASVAEGHRPRLEEIARTCPVALSLSGDVAVTMTFRYA